MYINNVPMRVKKRLFVCFFLLVFIFVSGCASKKETINQENNKQDIQSSYYISFTVTKEEGDNLNTYNYIYDFESEKVELKGMIPYTSQYPLTAYSYSEDALYYTHRRNGEGDDEIYRKNLTTGQTDCLTDTLFAVNYIFPFGDKVYIAAVENGTRTVGLFKYQNGTLKRLLENKDSFVWQVNYNPDLNQMVFNTYSDEEASIRAEKNNGMDVIGMNSIYIVDIKKDSIIKIAEPEEGYMSGILLDSFENIYYQLGGYKQLKDGKGTDTFKFNGLDIDKIIYMNKTELYYVSVKGEIIKYRFFDGKKTILYTLEEDLAAINNAIILHK